MNNLYNTLLSEFVSPWYFSTAKSDNIAKTKDGDYKLTLVVPGYGKEDVTLQVTESNYLEIKLKQDEGYTYRYKLSNKIDPTKISAECKNGILTVTLPQKAESTSKLIKIDIQ